MKNNLLEKFRELQREQNSPFNSICQKCRLILQFQELYFLSNNLAGWEYERDCNRCGLAWKIKYGKIKN